MENGGLYAWAADGVGLGEARRSCGWRYLCVFEKMLFNTSHFDALLLNRFTGEGMEAVTATGTMPMNPVTHPPAKFLSSSELQIGLAVAAAFLAAALRLLRYRGPI